MRCLIGFIQIRNFIGDWAELTDQPYLYSELKSRTELLGLLNMGGAFLVRGSHSCESLQKISAWESSSGCYETFPLGHIIHISPHYTVRHWVWLKLMVAYLSKASSRSIRIHTSGSLELLNVMCLSTMARCILLEVERTSRRTHHTFRNSC